MKFFFLLVAISLCSGAPQLGFKVLKPSVTIPVLTDVWSAEDLTSEDLIEPISVEAPDSSEEVTIPLTAEETRLRLMKYMRELEREIDEDIFEKDYRDVESSLFKLNKRLWPQMINLSDKIYYSLDDPKAIEREHKVRLGLKRDVARLRFKAGARKCQSPDEAFYSPLERCVLVGATEPELNPCSSKKDMILYDGLDNKAVCDCVEDERNLAFSDIDGQCYRQNIQGPCQNGTWFAIFEGKPVCQEVPADCPADGQHVYWSHDPLVAEPQCLKLGVRGPCLEGNVLGRNKAGQVACTGAARPKPLVELRTSCAVGSYRGQTKQC